MIFFCNNSIFLNTLINANINPEPIFYKILFFLNDSKNSLLFLILLYCYICPYNYNVYIKTTIVFLYFYVGNTHCQSFTGFFFFIKNNNPTLINGVLLLHPIFLYSSLCFLIFFWRFAEQFKLKVIFFKKLNECKNIIFVLSFSSLYLGCYWAQQETNWGGWWNWDPIELLALLICLISLFILHLKKETMLRLFQGINIVPLLLFVMLFLSRYDILNSIHSFAVSSKLSLYLEVKLLITIMYFYIFCKCFFHFLKKTFKKNMFFEKCIYILYICIFIWIFNKYFYEINPNTNLKNFFFFFFVIVFFVCSINNNQLEIYLVKTFNKNYIFYINLYLNINNTHSNKTLHYIFYMFLFFTLYEYSSDVFLKLYDKHFTNYKQYSINKIWFHTDRLNKKSLSNFNQIVYKNMFNNNYFSLSQRFFFQNIFSNSYFNYNYIDINTNLMFFQKNLILYSLYAAILILMIIFKSHNHMKAV